MINDEKMYTFDARIRFSECDHNRILTYESLIDYFQDCSMFHAEDSGIGFVHMESIHTAWLLNSWQIIFNELPKFSEKVTVGTICHEVKGFLGKRNYFMEGADGKLFAYANTFWSYMDMEKMVPVKVPQYMIDAYGVGKPLDMEYAGRKIRLPDRDPDEVKPQITVKEENLDTNNHVNNAQYIRMALNNLPKSLIIRQIRVEYKDQAHLGDVITPVLFVDKAETGKIFTVSLNDKTGNGYSTVEVITK